MATFTFDSDRVAENLQKWMVSANLHALTPRSLEKTFLAHRTAWCSSVCGRRSQCPFR